MNFKSELSNEKIKYCIDCGHENSDDSQFCTYCGKHFDENQQTFCTSCGQKNIAEARFCVNCGKSLVKNPKSICSNCGEKNKDESKFCIRCGKSLYDTDHDKNSNSNITNQNRNSTPQENENKSRLSDYLSSKDIPKKYADYEITEKSKCFNCNRDSFLHLYKESPFSDIWIYFCTECGVTLEEVADKFKLIDIHDKNELIWILNKKETLNKEEWETIGVINKNIRRQGYNITNKY